MGVERLEKSEDQKASELVHWSMTFKARIKQFASILQRASGVYTSQNLVEPFTSLLAIAEQFDKDVKFSDLKTYGGVRLPALASFVLTASRNLLDYASNYKSVKADTADDFLGQLAARLDVLARAIDLKLGITPQARLKEIDTQIANVDKEIAAIQAEPLRADKVNGKTKLRSLKELQKAEARAVFASVIERMNDKNRRIDSAKMKKARLLEDRKSFENVSLTEAVADDNIQRATSVIAKESQNLKKALETAGVPNRVAFALVRGGVIVNGTLNFKAFEERRMNVIRVGEAFQKGGVGMGRAQEDARSRQFVILNQWILAIKNPDKPVVYASKKISQTSKAIKKLKQNQGDSKGPVLLKPPPDLTFATVLSIIRAKTGKQYIDVAGVSTNNSPYEMRSREIPGVRFIWLMEKSDYLAVSRGNPLHITEASIPALSRSHGPATTPSKREEPTDMEKAKRRQQFGYRFGENKKDEDSDRHMRPFGVPLPKTRKS